MSHPSLSLLTALRVFFRSSALRSTARAAVACRAQEIWKGAFQRAMLVLALLASSAVLIGLLVAMAFIIPQMGRYAELRLAPYNVQRTFFALPFSPEIEPVWRAALANHSVSASPQDTLDKDEDEAKSFLSKLKHAKADRATLIGLSPEQRANLLALIDRRIDALKSNLAKNEESSGLRDAILLARLLKEGKTPEQAAVALREASKWQSSPTFNTPPDLLALKKSLQTAIVIDASTITLSDFLSVSSSSLPQSSNPVAYADYQAQNSGAVLGRGLLLLFGALFIPVSIFTLNGWARGKIQQCLPHLLRELERQNIGDTTGPAKSSSKKPTL